LHKLPSEQPARHRAPLETGMIHTRKQLELLAPAKNADIGIEAINHGADAIYIGGPAFGAAPTPRTPSPTSSAWPATPTASARGSS
jgi:hypothetical protein